MNYLTKWLGLQPQSIPVVKTDLKTSDDTFEYYKMRGVEALQAYMCGEGDRRTWEQATELAYLARRGRL